MRISNEILSIKEAGKKDVDFLFNLRNKKYVYKYSRNARPIKYKEHINWANPIINNERKNILLYVVLYCKRKAGQIRFDLLRKSKAEVNISFLRKYHGKGIAVPAMKKSIETIKDKGLEKIIAIILPENLGSIKFFEKCGFKDTKKLTKENAKIYELNLRL